MIIELIARGRCADGEVVLGLPLDAEMGVRVLHARRIPGSKANIDHIAVGPRGVFKRGCTAILR